MSGAERDAGERSFLERVAAMDDAARAAWLAEQPAGVVRRLMREWRWWERPGQKAPPPPWRVWLVMAGRGYGKTRIGAEWVRAAAEGRARRIALVGATRLDVRQVVATTTPRPVPLLRRLLADPGVAVTRGRTHDNRAHLAAGFVDAVEAQFGGTRLGRQELEGEMVDDVAGALWTRAMLEACRTPAPPALVRVVVAVDPPAGIGGDRPVGLFALRPERVAAWCDARWRRVAEAAAGDVLLMRGGPGQVHLAVNTGAGLVHADASLRRVVERPGAPAWPVLAIWRVG